jgi:hypothetical protein
MEIVLKLLFLHLWSFSIKLCFILSKEIGQMFINTSAFWTQPKMSGFLQNNVQDPDFWEL